MEQNRHIRAIILAAGTGSRLRPLTNDRPKPLIEVGGVAIIDHVLNAIREVGVQDIVVVGGYLAEVLHQHLENHHWGITFVKNPEYTKGNLLTLKAALHKLEGNILLMNADHIYPVELSEKFIDFQWEGVKIGCDTDRKLGEDDMKVLLDERGYLFRIGKKLENYNAGYIGITFIPAGWISHYRSAMEKTLRLYGEMSVVEQVLGKLAERGTPPLAVELSGFGWSEIDSLDDLRQAEHRLNHQ